MCPCAPIGGCDGPKRRENTCERATSHLLVLHYPTMSFLYGACAGPICGARTGLAIP
jgi:hypothetical protein